MNFALSKSGDSIGLFARDGAQIDAITFGPQTNNVSQGRYPDGAPAIYFMTTPTPRTANVPPFNNRPPVLAPISNQDAFPVYDSFNNSLSSPWSYRRWSPQRRR